MFRYALTALLLVGCSMSSATADPPTVQPPALKKGEAAAIFAGGCFWCMEKPFDKIDGVKSTLSGYTDGAIEGPTYKQVSSGRTTHTEALYIVYDPKKVDYERLVEVFWHNIDPAQEDGQFCDRGTQYRSGIYTSNDEEKAIAERTKKAVMEELGATVVTEIDPFDKFWVAEEYHQDFYKKNPGHYTRYRTGCGRDARLKEIWGDKAGH